MQGKASRIADAAAPFAVGLLALLGWEAAVRALGVPHYVLPGPLLIGQTLVADWPLLSSSLLWTLLVALKALALAALFGTGLAVLFTQWRWLERALLPYAVVLQVTPVVAIAPLIIIWTDNNIPLALLICAWIVAFFPILSNTIVGLRSVDHNLVSLFELYGASRWQTLLHLKLPAALPYFLAGLRISAGLALIGAVVAEFVAGTGGAESGLAYRIMEAGHQLKIPRMFAALALISLAGILLYVLAGLISHLALRRWHDSAASREI
jgi:NitT/TauT family transport system permease protein